MKLHKLIPRNNWDYGVRSLFAELAAIRGSVAVSPKTERIFGRKAIWTNSGRASLYAILKSLELPAGSSVGVPLFCCSVVFNAICQAGLSPRFVDSNMHDCNVSVEDLYRKRTDLAAVVAVHMFGNPCDMDAIIAIADPLPVIEDCAQSVFSTYKERQAGSLATASFFSFRCGKYISAGEGSAITCGQVELQEKVERIVVSFAGWSPSEMLKDSLMTFVKSTLYHRPWYGLVGYPIGMRLDRKFNLTAKDGFEARKIAPTHFALVNSRLAGFREQINIQREHAYMLLKALTPGKFGLPSEEYGCSSNWFQFALRFQGKEPRDAMADFLFSQGIDTSRYLDDIVDVARSDYGYRGDCPNAELLSKTILLVPIHYSLSGRDMEHIARTINEGSLRIEDLMAA